MTSSSPLVTDAAPCFEALVTAGELDGLGSCRSSWRHRNASHGRNFYIVADDDEYFEAVSECAYG